MRRKNGKSSNKMRLGLWIRHYLAGYGNQYHTVLLLYLCTLFPPGLLGWHRSDEAAHQTGARQAVPRD